MRFTITQIAEIIDGKIEGNGSIEVNKISTLESAKSSSISFLHNAKYENLLYTTKASAVIVKTDFKAKKEVKTTLVRVDDPYSSMTLLLTEYEKLKRGDKIGIEEPSHIGLNSVVGYNIYRAAYSYVGDNVSIGDNCKIFPNTFIGDNVTLGNNSIIHAGVKIYSDTEIGNNCIIHSGAVIGSDGFGFAPQKDGTYTTIPQVGNVIIEDNVSIGANTVVDRATLESTIIKSIPNLLS